MITSRSGPRHPAKIATRLLTATAALAVVLAGCVPPSAPTSSNPTTTTAAPTTTTTTTIAGSVPRVLFGMGPEADQALGTNLVKQTPVGMLTSWYNGPSDLTWMAGWHGSVVSRAYSSGRALHLVVWTNSPEVTTSTKYGPACGRSYPLSDGFDADMARLADIFAGNPSSPPLYVTLFTEFQTYGCTDNAWNPDPGTNAYYRALKDRYLEAMAIFRVRAPNARVSLGWGGWQSRWDNPSIGGGRSMFAAFADVMAASQFQSFQAMQTDTNVNDIRNMTEVLGHYGPVMLSHYKPDNGSNTTFAADMRSVLTDAYLANAVAQGLFAISFMDNVNLSASTANFDLVANGIRRYGRMP